MQQIKLDQLSAEISARFEAKIEKISNGCWFWCGAIDRYGYGVFKINGRTVKAHRCAYTLFVGEISIGMCVCHLCDNPRCVNPDHLFLGSQRDNMFDKTKKGRVARGECLKKSKLLPASVRRIRLAARSGTKPQVIAQRFGISLSTVYRIIKRQIWKHV